MLLRILGAWLKSPNNHILSYKEALQRTRCESIETTVKIAHEEVVVVGALLRMGDHRLPKRVMPGERERERERELENGGKRASGRRTKNGRTAW